MSRKGFGTKGSRRAMRGRPKGRKSIAKQPHPRKYFRGGKVFLYLVMFVLPLSGCMCNHTGVDRTEEVR